MVMKTDDDVFVHLDNLEKRLRSVPDTGVYYGREFRNDFENPYFMTGLGYAISWNIVEWIATDPYTEANKVGQEDLLLSNWLHHEKIIDSWISEDYEIYDEPESKQGWAHPYTEGTILIHQLKNEKWFLKAAKQFIEISRL